MFAISIFNDVLGPVMRGPSSSHTAGSYNIAQIIRTLRNKPIKSANFNFDPRGSYAPTYKILGVDKAFATGLLGLSMIDEKFSQALDICQDKNIRLDFTIEPIPGDNHPNTTLIELEYNDGEKNIILAESIGGGRINLKGINNWSVKIDGSVPELFIETQNDFQSEIIDKIKSSDLSFIEEVYDGEKVLLHFSGSNVAQDKFFDELCGIDEKKIKIWSISPILKAIRGKGIFSDTAGILKIAKVQEKSLGEIAIQYEMEILGATESDVRKEMDERLQIMIDSVDEGFDEKNISMQLTRPSATKILQSEKRGLLAIGGIHARAAARAMATMHVDNSLGVVCAAPTGGSAGVLAGVIYTLIKEKKIDREKAIDILFAASAIGILIAKRATFSAELAGCQVEIGASAAMAAAAMIEYADGNAQDALDAAAIALQNSMGLVCDTVQGGCEIPCHTRNALGVSNAFLCADLILGGYHNPIPLDETIDAMYAVGKAMPIELRCTSKGGIAIAPSAQAIKNNKE